MSGHLRAGSATRRRFLMTAASATATTTLGTIALPSFSRSSQRPVITHGVQSGDVSTDTGMVWARTDRPARMLIEASTGDSFKDVCHASYVDALPETDFTAKALLENLPAGQDIFYRLRFQDLLSGQAVSEPAVGQLRTAPADRRSISLCGQATPPGKAGALTRHAATCAPTRRCSEIAPTFSFIAATAYMRTAQYTRNRRCRTARRGAIL